MYAYKQTSFERRFTQVTVALLMLAALAVNPSWFSQPAAAQSSTMSGTITVVGEGRVTIEPDIARAIIGVEVLSPTVAEASAENRQLIESIIATLQEEGIAEKDIQTSGFNIFAERYGPNGPLAEDEVQYRVNNMVSVVIRDLDRVGAILDAAIAAGANNIQGIGFEIEDPSSVESDARSSAVEDARTKAEELASLTGVAVGRVISISEVVGGNGGYYQSNFDLARNEAGGGGGFAPGELSLIMRLQITYALEELSASAASMPAPESSESSEEVVIIEMGNELENTSWILSGIQQDGVMTTAGIDQEITAQFEDGRMSGSAGCNTYRTDFTVDNGTIELGAAITTRMACPDEIMEREQLFLQALESVTTYSVDGDLLTLLDDEGNIQLTFEAAA